MNKNTDGCIGIRILSPLTGTAVPLEEVPDPVFSQKIIGDGIAILPRDGNLVSPIDGEVVSIAETLHAYGLRSEDGIEVMVHFGLETVALKGECFQCCVKIGDKVKAAHRRCTGKRHYHGRSHALEKLKGSNARKRLHGQRIHQ